MATERTKGAKGAARSELVAVRFDPRTKYLMDIAAREQRRSIANFVEWAVERALRDTMVKWEDREMPVSEAASFLWDVEEADRFYYLARALPHLLDHEEQMLFKLMHGTEHLWQADGDGKRTIDGKALRQWFPGAKYAVSTGADIDQIREALNGNGAAVKAVGLDKWAEARKG